MAQNDTKQVHWRPSTPAQIQENASPRGVRCAGSICSGAQIRYIFRMRLQILLSCNQSVSPSSANCKSRLLISFPSINSVPDISKKFSLNAFFISKTQIPFLLKEDYALWERPANKLLLHFFFLSSWYLSLLLCSKRKHNKRKQKNRTGKQNSLLAVPFNTKNCTRFPRWKVLLLL